MRERAAARAEEALTRFRQMEFLRDHAEGDLEAVVRGADEYGLTVELEDYWVKARASVGDLPPDRYRYLERDGILKGRRGRSFRPGDRVRTRAIEVDLVACEVRVKVLAG